MCIGHITRDISVSFTEQYSIAGDTQSSSKHYIPDDIPEHCDNPFLNRDVVKGILGFRYENKVDGQIVVYTSLEAKTYCKLMKTTPLKKHNIV